MALEVCLEHKPSKCWNPRLGGTVAMLSERDSGASHQKTDELKLSNPITNPIINLIKMQFTLRKESYPKPETQDQRSLTLNSATPSLVELPTVLPEPPCGLAPVPLMRAALPLQLPAALSAAVRSEAWRESDQSWRGALTLVGDCWLIRPWVLRILA